VKGPFQLRNFPLKLIGFAALLSLGSQPALAQHMSTPELTSYQLPNGLEVILAPDHKVPKVSLNLQYRVGSLNEPAGRSGFAHLFEHLMLLAGTPAYPRMDETFTASGVNFNGFTFEDYTTYVADGMAATLPLMLSVYADQMANIGAAVDQSDLDRQRGVVLNEMRQNVLDAPGMSAVTALRGAMFPDEHPYSRAVIGSIPDLEAATLGDVRSFFDAYYAPNNAVLVIVGDFDLAATQAMIEDTFGRVPRGVDVVQPVAEPFEPMRARIETMDALAAPMVYLAFDGPDTTDGDANASLFLAADLMSNEAGILRDRLVNTGIATAAGGFWAPGKLGGRFMVYASGGSGVSAEQLEAALREALAEFVATPIDKDDFERSRSGLLLSFEAQLEAFSTRSSYIALSKVIEDDISHVFGEDPDFANATAGGAEAAVDAVLKLADASVAVALPGPRGDYPPVLSEPSGKATPITVPQRAGVEIPMLAAGGPLPARLPERQTATLSNGIEVIHYRTEGAPLAYISAMVTGGFNNDPRGKEGLYRMAADMAWRGAGDRDLIALGRAAKDIGAVIGSWSGALMSGANLSVPPADLAAGVELLADVIQEPQFAADQWDVLKAGMLNYLVQRDSDVTDVAQRALSEVIFFPKPDESDVMMTTASVSSITLEEAAAAYEEMITPRTMVFQSVGDLPLDEVVAALEKRFGAGWTDDDAGIASIPSLAAVFPAEQRVYLVPMPGTSQATIHIARPAPGSEDPAFPSAMAVANLLAVDFAGRLNSVIREQKGYSYGVSGSLWDWYEQDSALTVTIPVQIDATGPALAEAFIGFDSLVSRPVTGPEIDRSVSAYHSALASLPETAAGFFGAVVNMQASGIDFDETIAYAERMTRLDLAEVQAEALKLALLDRAVIIIAGDAERIVPQLNAMGITDIETITMPNSAAAVTPASVPAN
jgi:zinc protease